MIRMFDIFSLYELACVLLPCLVYQIIFVVKRRKTKEKVSGSYLAWVWIFLFYLWMVFDVTGIGTMGDIIRFVRAGKNPVIGGYNFIPFDSVGAGFLLNIIMCMPLGFLLPFIFKEYRKCSKTVMTGVVFSLLIEMTQIFNFRATDVDDLMTNTFGTLIGYMIWRTFVKIFKDRFETASDGRYEAMKYILTAIAGVFFLYHPFLLL
jgi:glycopeptide antibiotics resistance protein